MLRAVKQKALSVALADSLQGSPRDHAASLSGKSLLSTPSRAKVGQALPGIATVSWLNFQAFLSPLPLVFSSGLFSGFLGLSLSAVLASTTP